VPSSNAGAYSEEGSKYVLYCFCLCDSSFSFSLFASGKERSRENGKEREEKR